MAVKRLNAVERSHDCQYTRLSRSEIEESFKDVVNVANYKYAERGDSNHGPLSSQHISSAAQNQLSHLSKFSRQASVKI